MIKIQSLNGVLYSNDPSDLPLTDLDAASSLPYDTDIPEGGQYKGHSRSTLSLLGFKNHSLKSFSFNKLFLNTAKRALNSGF